MYKERKVTYMDMVTGKEISQIVTNMQEEWNIQQRAKNEEILIIKWD